MNLIDMFKQIPTTTHHRSSRDLDVKPARTPMQYNEPETDFMHSQGYMSIHIFHKEYAIDKCIYWITQEAKRKAKANQGTFVLSGVLVDVKIEEKRVYVKAMKLYTPTKLLELCGVHRCDSVTNYKKYFRRVTKGHSDGNQVNGIKYEPSETKFGTMYRLKNE